MVEPLVTVCMPAFNAERFLDAAIGAIRSQTFRDFELLLLDDQSTDNTAEIALRHAREDPRVLVSRHSHQGYVRLLNEGLQRASGSLFARMDADDLTATSRFERQVSFLSAHSRCVAVGTQVLIVDPEGWPLQRIEFPLVHDAIEVGHLAGRYQMAHGTLMMRTAALKELGGYRVEFEPAEDLDLLLRLGEHGELANLPDRAYMYRVHPRQVTVQQYATQQKAIAEALAQTGQRRGLDLRLAGPFIHKRPDRRWQTHVLWARLALQEGFRSSAGKHILQALCRRPWSRTAWRIAVAIAGGDSQARV